MMLLLYLGIFLLFEQEASVLTRQYKHFPFGSNYGNLLKTMTYLQRVVIHYLYSLAKANRSQSRALYATNETISLLAH